MPLWPNFCGGAYRTQSATIAVDACINLYLETTHNDADPKKAVFYGTPGQRLRTTFTADPIRGLFSQDGRIVVVAGPLFAEYLPATNTFISGAAVADDGKPVTFASNGKGGNQIAVCSAGSLYIYNLTTNVLSAAVVLPFVPVMVGFMDGYFLANEKNTIKMWFSNLENGLVWSATDFFTRSSTSDNITGFAVNNRRIWVIGSKTTEIFQDSGDATTPFIPYPGTVINEGTNAYASIVSVADTVLWAGSTNEFGAAQIFAASSLQPRTISTPAISFAISAVPDATEAEALAYTQNGHNFVCWTWHTLSQTWCYDLTEGLWHQRGRALLQPDGSYVLDHWTARGCCAYLPAFSAQPAVLVGQWGTGALCQLDLTYNVDYESSFLPTQARPILRQRTAPYLSAENQWVFLQQIELGIAAQAGGMPAGQVQLFLSSNNGITIGSPINAAQTLQMDGTAVAQWFQLGRYRADRLVLAVRQIGDPVCVWGPGLFLRAQPGTGLL
jgi:hypothetical protein